MDEKKELLLDLMISSPAQRAQSTAEVYSEYSLYRGAVRVENDLYEAHADVYIDILKDLDDKYGTVLFVGHFPEISDVIAIMTGSNEFMAPGNLACIELPIGSWGEIVDCNGALKWVQAPQVAN